MLIIEHVLQSDMVERSKYLFKMFIRVEKLFLEPSTLDIGTFLTSEYYNSYSVDLYLLKKGRKHGFYSVNSSIWNYMDLLMWK